MTNTGGTSRFGGFYPADRAGTGYTSTSEIMNHFGRKSGRKEFGAARISITCCAITMPPEAGHHGRGVIDAISQVKRFGVGCFPANDGKFFVVS